MAATNRLVGAVLVTLLVAVTGFAMGFFAGLPLGPMAFVTGCAGAIAAVGVTVAAERQATQRGWPTLGLFGPSAIDSSIHQFRKGLIASQEPTRLAI